ncbi:MFS family permease [Sphingomonas vulcanisoli]|uniref:MFS family permease n=1 Tax=Sphingomonas vulcanisoli TaxID=1658060 RepID=A0ABX0TSP8_9SPHN|nr:MFS transporter [Sphingomonas vulcanisoli]NIJ08542.1 MFS family permease [Sphingomonas vulcanisoli]
MGETESRRYAIWFVAILILAYTFSYIDRTILTLMVKPIRDSLQISDVQLSLLHGLAFAIFYTFMGIPIGRLVDRYRRTVIVAIGIAIWSLATALCGFAATFVAMFAARIAVGVGESTLSPAAYSMLADKFSGKKLVRALAVYQSAIYLGPAIATLFGGVLLGKLAPVDGAFGHFEPWQQVFVAVGLPGLLIALVVLTLREPARRGAGATVGIPSFGAVLAHMRGQFSAYGLLILGLCLQSVMWNGTTFWIPEHLKRAYGWSSSDVAWGYGPVIAICGTLGGLTGGWIAGWLRDKGRSDSNVVIGVIAAATACPFAIAAPLMLSGQASLALYGMFLFLGAMPYGGAAAAFQEITPNRMRGQVSAVYLFWLNLAGIGVGATLVALVTQHVYGGDHGLSAALATVGGSAAIASVLVLTLCLAPYRRAQAAIA